MKKILICSGVLFITSILFITTAFVVSGFDIFELTNFNNYTKNEEYFDELTSLELIDCEITEINEYEGNKILVVYYTNEDAIYDLEKTNNNLSVIAKIKKSNSFGIFNPKGIEIYLPKNNNINISIVLEQGVVDIEEVNVNNLIIVSEDAVINIEEITANNIEINMENGVINIDDILCNTLKVITENVVINLEDIDCPNIEVVMENGMLNIDLPYQKNKYTLDIESKATCNVSSGGTGTYILKIKADNGVVNVKFD